MLFQECIETEEFHPFHSPRLSSMADQQFVHQQFLQLADEYMTKAGQTKGDNGLDEQYQVEKAFKLTTPELQRDLIARREYLKIGSVQLKPNPSLGQDPHVTTPYILPFR